LVSNAAVTGVAVPPGFTLVVPKSLTLLQPGPVTTVANANATELILNIFFIFKILMIIDNNENRF
jgi:hypothetical protein